MTQLLVWDTAILAVGPIEDMGDSLYTPEMSIPKALIPGYQIVETSLPSDFSPATYEWIGGVLKKKSVPQPKISSEQAKANYIGMMESRADKLEAEGKIVEALLLRESLK
jgi:hypothetical protein